MTTSIETKGNEKQSLLRLLLTCGMITGPLFTLVWFVQGFIRADYDPMRYAISSLSVGELGWIQIANFLITGTLLLAFSVGLLRARFGELPFGVPC